MIRSFYRLFSLLSPQFSSSSREHLEWKKKVFWSIDFLTASGRLVNIKHQQKNLLVSYMLIFDNYDFTACLLLVSFINHLDWIFRKVFWIFILFSYWQQTRRKKTGNEFTQSMDGKIDRFRNLNLVLLISMFKQTNKKERIEGEGERERERNKNI